jgi:tetratricopeptide (TPR) repeat protein
MKRPRVPLLDNLESAKNLLQNQRPDVALELLKKAVTQIQSQKQWQEVKVFLMLHAATYLDSDHPEWLTLYCHVLTGTREKDLLLELTADHTLGTNTAMLLLHRSWGLLEAEAYQAVHDLLSQALPYLQGSALGVGQKRLALAAFHLGLEWREGFEAALTQLQGRLLGLALIDWAGCCVRSGQLEAARDRLTQALPKLRGDQYHLAWVRYNLGEIAIQCQDADAERHFSQAEILSRSAEARALRSRALQGMGRWRRHQGDLLRALDAYQKATDEDCDDADKRAAFWSLGRTQRLSGRSQEALESLECARQLGSKPGIELEVGAAWLSLGKLEKAKTLIHATQHEPYRSVALILQAELARLEKHGVLALELLAQADVSSLNTKEELLFWQDLHQLAVLGGLELPELPKRQQTTVEILACGVLQVRVNGGLVRISPTGRVGELLVFLLESGGAAHVETVIEKFYPEERIPKRKKSAVWDLVKRLRQALGWEGSVLAVSNTLQLEPEAKWVYDVAQAREQRRAVVFLEGVRSNWALEVGQELAALGGRVPWEYRLN